MQLLCDQHGNVATLHSRDYSVLYEFCFSVKYIRWNMMLMYFLCLVKLDILSTVLNNVLLSGRSGLSIALTYIHIE